MDQGRDVRGVRLPVHHEFALTNLLPDARADAVEAHDRTALNRDQLDDARCGQDRRLSVSGEVVLDGTHLVSKLFARLLLGHADRGDLRLAEGHARDVDISLHSRVQAGNLFGDEDALHEAAVCQLKAGNDVADRVDVADAGVQAIVGDDEAAIQRDAGLLVAQALGHGATADSDQKDVGVERLAVLGRDVHTLLVLRGRGEAGVRVELDAALTVGALELLGDGLVFVVGEVGQGLDNRDLGTEAAPHGGELQADNTAAENHGGGGNPVHLECLVGGDHAAADLETGDRARVGAGRQNDVAAGDALAVDLDGVRVGEAAPAGDNLDVARLEQALQALVQAGNNRVAILAHLSHVNAVEGGGNAELGRLAHGLGRLCGVQVRLGGDAAAVQAGAAHLIAVDEGDLHAQLRSAQGGRIAAGTRTQNDNVVGRFAQGLKLLADEPKLRWLFSWRASRSL